LGNKGAVSDFANIWKQNASDIQLTLEIGLLDYVTNNSFTPEELAAFRLGLSVLPSMFNNCYIEIENANKKVVSENI
jgi:hypothetical protein